MLALSYLVSYRSPRLIPLFIFSVYYTVFFVIAPNITEDYYQVVYEHEFALSNWFMAGVLVSLLLLLISGGFSLPSVPCSNHSDSVRYAAERVFCICLIVGLANVAMTGTPWLQENIEASRHAGQGSGYISMFTSRGLPISATFLIWNEWLYSKRVSRKIMLIAIATFAMLVLGAYRTYAILFLLSLFVLYCCNARRIPVVASILAATAATAIFSIITLAKFENGSLETLLQTISHRVLYELIWTTQDALQIVEIDGLWWGASYVMDLVSALPGTGQSFGDYLVLFNDPGSPIAGMSPLTPSIVGESYVNFGTLGVMIAGLSVPLVFVLAARMSSISVETAAPLTASVVILISQMVEVGYGQVLASRLLPAAVFLGMMYWFYERRRRSTSGQRSPGRLISQGTSPAAGAPGRQVRST